MNGLLALLMLFFAVMFTFALLYVAVRFIAAAGRGAGLDSGWWTLLAISAMIGGLAVGAFAGYWLTLVFLARM